MIYTLTLNPAIDRELTVPAIEFDRVLRADESRLDFGGKGFNVSRLLSGLGAPNTALGFVGGKAGEILRDGLQSIGIATDFIWVAGETRTNFSLVTPSGHRTLKVNEKGPRVDAAQQLELLAKIESLARPGDWWVLAGSLPPGVEDDFYARILRLLHGRGANALLDTSGEALRLGCAERPFLVKPNAEEAGVLTGLPVANRPEIAAAARAIRGLGARNVIISLGKDGALLQSAAAAWLARSPAIQEKNPIGAGDSLVGGLAWALSAGHPLPEALGWGVAAGAATASLSGTAVGSRALIETLHTFVQIEPFQD